MRSITESLEYIDISNGTSRDFNKFIQSVSDDIVSVFNMANNNSELTQKNMDLIIQENLFLQRKIKELESMLYSIEQTNENKASGRELNTLYKTFYTADDIEYMSDKISHNPSYGIITLPHSNIQKIPLSKYPKGFLRKNMDIKVEVDGTTYNIISDPDLINIIDGDDTTFWSKVIEKDSSINQIDFSITINMPLRILSNLSINSIGIKPHPVYSISLNDIEYKDVEGTTEYRIPTFPTEGEEAIPIQAIDNAKFIFPPIDTTSITFHFTQPYYVQENDKRLFVIGMRNIDLENIKVTSEEASFITTFKIPGDNQYFNHILEPSVITLNNQRYESSITQELFRDKTGVQSLLFGSDIGEDINTVYVKTTLKKIGDMIPAIRGIEIQYMPK